MEQVDEDPDLGVVHGFYEIFFKAVVEIEFWDQFLEVENVGLADVLQDVELFA